MNLSSKGIYIILRICFKAWFCSNVDSTPIRPPSFSIIFLQIANPNPVPCLQAFNLTGTNRGRIYIGSRFHFLVYLAFEGD